jgi:hypothetical protein
MSTEKAKVAVFVGELHFSLEADIDTASDYGLKKVRVCDGDHAAADVRFEKTYTTDLWSEDALLRCMDELVDEFKSRLVLTFSEVTVVPAGFISERLGVSGLPLDVANRCRSKFLMRQALADARMPVPEFRLIDSVEDLAGTHHSMSGFPPDLQTRTRLCQSGNTAR